MEQIAASVVAEEEPRLTTFPNDSGYDELVVVRGIRFRADSPSVHGVAHVGYLPGTRILGLSKFARVVEACARGFRTQERMTTEIAEWLGDGLRPRGIGVVVEAEHAGGSAVTSALHGLVRDDPRTRQEFLRLALGRTR